MRNRKPMSFDDLLLELQDQKNMQEDPNHISLEALFNEVFMSKHTSCKSIAAFLEKGNFDVKTEADLDNYPEELFDRHVVRETGFSSWEEMRSSAKREYADENKEE